MCSDLENLFVLVNVFVLRAYVISVYVTSVLLEESRCTG